MRTQSINYY